MLDHSRCPLRLVLTSNLCKGGGPAGGHSPLFQGLGSHTHSTYSHLKDIALHIGKWGGGKIQTPLLTPNVGFFKHQNQISNSLRPTRFNSILTLTILS